MHQITELCVTSGGGGLMQSRVMAELKTCWREEEKKGTEGGNEEGQTGKDGNKEGFVCKWVCSTWWGFPETLWWLITSWAHSALPFTV